MEVKWLVEDSVFEEDIDSLIEEIQRQGMEVRKVKYVPFQGGEYYNYFNVNDCVVFYGSLNLMVQLKREVPWIPLGWCTLQNFECSKYYAYFGKYLLNSDYVMMPVAELIRQKEMIGKMLGRDGMVFVRPSSGFKQFTGRLVACDELTLESLDYGFYYEEKDLLVVVSSPKNVDKEWRFVVAEGRVISGSEYKADGRIGMSEVVDESALDLANKIAENDWTPDPIFVIDICKSEDEYFLLEMNSFSCSGFYSCPTEPIVRVVSRIALDSWKEVQ